MALPYTVIKTDKQYYKYCDELWELFELNKPTREQKDIIELLEVLIDKYDDEHSNFGETPFTPIELLASIMDDHKMKSTDMALFLGISKSHMSDILNYRRTLSKEMIRKLAERFKVLQEAFNRPYELKKTKRKTKKRKLAKAA